MIGGMQGGFGSGGVNYIHHAHSRQAIEGGAGAMGGSAPSATLSISSEASAASSMVRALHSGQNLPVSSSPSPGGVPIFSGAMAVSRAS